jgi:hypothetical protein
MDAPFPSLRGTLGALVALAGCSGDCPHTVVDRRTTPQITADQACALAQGGRPDFVGDSLPGARCTAPCGDPAVTRCALPSEYYQAYEAANDPSARGDAGTVDGGTAAVVCPPTSVTLTCEVTHTEGTSSSGCPVPGRRPAGLARPDLDADAPAIGAWFAGCAHFEAASVVAFDVLREELVAHGAPDALVRAAELAAAQEVRHAALMGELAERFGARASSPRVARRGVRPLAEVARENVVEGVVRETFAAAQALWAATRARDPEVRKALREIADDECEHASLSWAVAAWASSRLPIEERRALEAAMRETIDALAGSAGDVPGAALRDVAGLPDGAASKRLVALLDAELWARA